MVSQTTLLSVLVVLAAFFVMTTNAKEGWRPFAWYGYPGTTKGSVGYQARGDWCGVDPATRKVDPPLPLR
jgi:hypothetical protein